VQESNEEGDLMVKLIVKVPRRKTKVLEAAERLDQLKNVQRAGIRL
jgi:hypothetical protein